MTEIVIIILCEASEKFTVATMFDARLSSCPIRDLFELTEKSVKPCRARSESPVHANWVRRDRFVWWTACDTDRTRARE